MTNPRKIEKEKSERSTRRVKFCPKCGSTDVSWARGLPHLWSIWECKNCGYYGAFIIENGKLSQILQEKYARETHTQDKAKSA